MKKLFFILFTIVLFSCSSSNSPEKVFETYMKSSMAGTISENTDLLANDDGTPLSEKNAKEMVALINGMREYMLKDMKVDQLVVEEIKVLNIDYNEAKTKASLEYQITLKGENKKDDETKNQYMIKADDGWKIVNMVRGTSWLNR